MSRALYSVTILTRLGYECRSERLDLEDSAAYAKTCQDNFHRVCHFKATGQENNWKVKNKYWPECSSNEGEKEGQERSEIIC